MRRLLTIILTGGALLAGTALEATNVAVRFEEGMVHGFVLLSTVDGKPIAVGDLMQMAHGGEVTARLVYHFEDGSMQEETTVFSQHRTLSLTTYHLIQKGPTFSHPTEMWIDTRKAQVNVRYTDDKGNEKTESQRMKLPPDLVNGMVFTVLKNLRAASQLPEFSMVVATPKPRIVKLSIHSVGKDQYTIGGSHRDAVHYVIHVDIGGVGGMVAPLLGKQPPDGHMWITDDESPTFVKSEILSFLGGPIWRAELAAPNWPKSEPGKSEGSSAQKH